jgi:hypothetical protein
MCQCADVPMCQIEFDFGQQSSVIRQRSSVNSHRSSVKEKILQFNPEDLKQVAMGL